MKIPKIVITYSEVYDELLSKKTRVEYSKRMEERGKKFAKRIQKEWDKHAIKILTVMSKITSLKWKRDSIECFVAFNAPFSISEPVTLDIRNNFKHEINNLVHELVHVLFWDNKKKLLWPESNKSLYKKYRREKYNTKLHFAVEALVILTINKVFDKDSGKYLKAERFWEIWPKDPLGKEYKISWDIVQKERPENVLKELIRK